MAYLYNLAEILGYMGYQDTTDFLVVDDLDGNGPFFQEWNHGDSQPTETEVSDFWTAWQTGGAVPLAKTVAKSIIDATAGKVRTRFITYAPGQEMTYVRKEAEAEAFKAAGYPEGDISDYPFIEAEAAALSDTGEMAADTILLQRDSWETVGANIERERRTGKIAVDAQGTVGDVETARDAALAALDAITP